LGLLKGVCGKKNVLLSLFLFTKIEKQNFKVKFLTKMVGVYNKHQKKVWDI